MQRQLSKQGKKQALKNTSNAGTSAQIQGQPEARVPSASYIHRELSLKLADSLPTISFFTTGMLEKHNSSMDICHQCCETEKAAKYQGPPSQDGKLNSLQHHWASLFHAQMLSPISRIKSRKLSPAFSDVKAVSTLQPMPSMPSICKIQNIPIYKL